MSETFKYDAFISYRHLDPDQFIAKQLHKELETFRLPGNIARKRKDGKTKISRVFRDQEELPLATNLEDPIVEALKQSEWLIVICSPRLRESIWCQKEIETFIQFHGREHILTVLAEGEPHESFPEQLLYREYQKNNADGTVETVREKIEPLAADFRGSTNKERLKAIKNEVLRLLAPMFGLEYDDLKQRHRERKMKHIIAGISIAAVVGILFGIVSTFTAIRIQQQKEQIQDQAGRIQEQALEITEQAQEIAEQNETLRATQSESLAREALGLLEEDDREGALELAYYAMTEYEGIEMPYTSMAQRVLSSSLHLYELSGGRKPYCQIEAEYNVKFVMSNYSGDKVVIADEGGTLTCWSLITEQTIWEISTNNYLYEELCAFL
ncbi:MAG: toll/interleukin-1 receptor domain-containing protein, partial [Lachnospiraceae bacterium]